MSRTVTSALPRAIEVRGNEESFSMEGECLKVTGSTPLAISTDGPTTNWIEVCPGVEAHLTLSDADLEPCLGSAAVPAILVGQGAVLNLELRGVNLLESGWGRAGIELEDATVRVLAKSTGSLVVTSDFGAGIGGGVVGDERYGGQVIIDGGNMYVLGGKDSAGIGCGAGLVGAHGVPKGYDVTINGGSVYAKGSGSAAGIGGAHDRPCGTITINGGSVHAQSEDGPALGETPQLGMFSRAQVMGEPSDKTYVVRPLPFEMPKPVQVSDVSEVHDESLPWEWDDEGVLHASGFNQGDAHSRVNHACVDVTYVLEQPGAIAYRWKVRGANLMGEEIFDRYWFLSGSDGTFRSGSDFLGETDDFNIHLIEGLDPGTYKLTLGVFCFGRDGTVSLDLAPSA